MEHIERAIVTSQALEQTLDEEVARARNQRVLIRNFDAQALLDRAAVREGWNRRVRTLQQELGKHLMEVAEQYGLREVTIESLGLVAAEPARRLAESLAQVRALAGTLNELDALNHHLAQRASAVVRGFLGALTGGSATYNQRGESRPVTGSTYSGTA